MAHSQGSHNDRGDSDQESDPFNSSLLDSFLDYLQPRRLIVGGLHRFVRRVLPDDPTPPHQVELQCAKVCSSLTKASMTLSEERHVRMIEECTQRVNELRVWIEEEHVRMKEEYELRMKEQHMTIEEQRVTIEEQRVMIEEQRVPICAWEEEAHAMVEQQPMHDSTQKNHALELTHPRPRTSVGSSRRIRQLGTALSIVIKSPISDGSIVSTTCGCNGKLITSNDGIALFIPKGAIKEGDSVTIFLATSFCSPFILPSNCQTDLASPYYWIGVSESYCFQKPIQVEIEHFGACNPSHYQLLCCEDDDESYTMRPVDCSINFEVQDNIIIMVYF